MKVLVYGGTGVQGQPVVAALAGEGHEVRVVSRDPRAAAVALPDGVEVVEGSLGDPVSLAAASRGMDGVFLLVPATAPPHEMVAGVRAAVDAALDGGVERFVFTTSGVVPDAPTGAPIIDAKREVVELLRARVPHATTLRPVFYLENLVGPWTKPVIAGEGVLALPMPAEVPVSWISVVDAARAVAAAFSRPSSAGLTLDIGADVPVTGPEFAAILSTAVGREIAYVAIDPDAFADSVAPVYGRETADAVAASYRWEGGAGAAVMAPATTDALAVLGLELPTLAQWAGAQDWTPAPAAW